MWSTWIQQAPAVAQHCLFSSWRFSPTYQILLHEMESKCPYLEYTDDVSKTNQGGLKDRRKKGILFKPTITPKILPGAL